MKTKLLILGLMTSCLWGCTSEPQVIFKTEYIERQLPHISKCQRLSIPDCQPSTNGELYECTLKIEKNLNLCSDQADALIKWQEQQ